MVDAFGQPYLFKHDLRLLTCLITILAAHDQRHGHVIQDRKRRQQLMELVHETPVTVTQLATLLFITHLRPTTADHNTARRELPPQAQSMQNSALKNGVWGGRV